MRAALLVAFAPMFLAGTARAQPDRGPLRQDATVDDPLGLAPDADLRPPPAPARPEPGTVDRRRGPPPPAVEPAVGDVLSAIAAVREVDHRVRVELRAGLADVAVEMRFFSRARHPAEIRYRLPVPEGAALGALEVCAAERCRAGTADRSPAGRAIYDEAVRARGQAAAAPVAHASLDGDALVVRAAPVPPRGELTVRLRYVAAAPLRGGIARIVLPARGQDPRAAPAEVIATADGLLAPTVDGSPAEQTAVRLDPWQPAAIQASAAHEAPVAATAWRVACGERSCARLRVAAGPRPAEPVDLVLLIDASPSMEGPSRGRVLPALAAILAAAPSGSRVRALAFAAGALPVIEEPMDPASVPLAALASAIEAGLGSATRFEAAWAVAEPWVGRRRGGAGRLPPLLVVIGDGGITTGPASEAAFEAAARARVPVAVLNLAGRPAWAALREGAARTGGVVVDAAGDAQELPTARPLEPMIERVAPLFAPVVARATARLGRTTVTLPALRAGEEVVLERPLDAARGELRVGAARIPLGAPPDTLAGSLGVRLARVAGVPDPRAVLAAVDPADFESAGGDDTLCASLGPAARASGVSSDGAPVALAGPPVCAMTPAVPAARRGRGVPAETVLRMLRQRVVPIARQCFRSDRAGRADYSVRAEFHFELGDREVVRAEVTGAIAEDLRRCLLGAVDALDVPAFDGTVVVTYPVRTEPEPLPPTLELRPEVAREVDRLTVDR